MHTSPGPAPAVSRAPHSGSPCPGRKHVVYWRWRARSISILVPAPAAGSVRRALNSLRALGQSLAACCCWGCRRRRPASDEQDLNTALWKGDVAAEGPPDGAPPELSEAAARQASAALSAAMSAKLAAAAAALSGAAAAVATGKKAAIAADPFSPAGCAGQACTMPEPVAAQQQPDGFIKAASSGEPDSATAAGSQPPGDAAAEAGLAPQEATRLSHVDSLVQYFERLSPVKTQQQQQPQQQPGSEHPAASGPSSDSLDAFTQLSAAEPQAAPHLDGSSLSEASPQKEGGAAAPGSAAAPSSGSTRRPLPRRTESRRAFLRAISRHARFAGVPEEEEESGSPASAAAAEASDTPTGSSTAASPSAALLAARQPRSAALPSSKGTGTGRPTTSSRLQCSGGRSSAASDQQVAAELQDADGASEFSGISGNSSREAGLRCGWWGIACPEAARGTVRMLSSVHTFELPPTSCCLTVSSHFSRLVGHARRRSRRRDYPPLRGTSLFLFKASVG